MSGRPTSQQTYGVSNSNFSKLQNQVDDVKQVMNQNIEQVLRRGENLDELADKSSNLENEALKFNRTSQNIKRKMWWKNTKMTIILVLVVLIIIGTVIGVVVAKYGPNKSKSATTLTSSTTTLPKLLRALHHHIKINQ